MLKHVARIIRDTLRKIDTPGRMGGEEFAILLPGTDSIAARTFAQRLRKAIAKSPVVLDGKTISVTASIGIATMDSRDTNGHDALIRADGALYRAKK